jgi:hypothetical protein
MLKLAPSFIILLFLYVTVAWLSPGFDDEYFNITTIEKGYTYFDLITFINSMDVHPPGQYLLNKVLWDITNNWSAVRAFSACFAAIPIWFLWLYAAQGASRLTGLFSFIAICLNPALLLWCTSLRWYAYFVPVFTLLALLIMVNPKTSSKFWVLFFLLSLILLMIGYAAIIIVPSGLVVALYARKEFLRKEIKVIAIIGLISLFLAAYQLFIFFSMYVNGMSSQPSDYYKAMQYLFLHLLSNQGAMPISLFGLSLIAANLLLFCAALAGRRKVQFGSVSGLYILSISGLFVTKLTSKLRNLVMISAIQGVFQTKLYESIVSKPLLVTILALFAVGNLGSIYNVYMHRDTTKGGWNIPYGDVLADINEKRNSLACSSMQVVTHDPVIVYHAEKLAFKTVFVGERNWKEDIVNYKGCHATVQTFRGNSPQSLMVEYHDLIDQLPHKKDRISFGQDRFAQFKRRFSPDIPDYYVTVTYFSS